MKKALIVFAVILIGIISFSFFGCNKKTSELPPVEMQTQTDNPQAQLSSEALTAQAVSKIEAPQEAQIQQEATVAVQTQAVFAKPTNEEIQTALKNAGYYSGAIDGKLGPKSKNAIENFQKDNGLIIDGKVGPKTWAKLQAHLNVSSAQQTGD